MRKTWRSDRDRGHVVAESRINSTEPAQAFSKIKSQVRKAQKPHLITSEQEKIQLAKKYILRRQEEQKALLERQLKSKGPIQIRKASAADQLSLAVGTMYGMGGSIGIVTGLLKAVARSKGLIRHVHIKLHATSVINELVKDVAAFGNNVAGVGLMYFIIARTTSYLFQEELEHVPKLLHISLCGALTGALCKIVYGRRPALFAAGIGFIAAPLLHIALSKTNANINI